MSKDKVSEWSPTAVNNTDIGGINIAEGCAPSGINNAIRELMAQVKDMQAGTDSDNFAVGGNLTVTGTSTLTGAVTASSGITGSLSAGSGTITTTNWTIQESSGSLLFRYQGSNRMRLDSSGNLTVIGNITAYGTL